MSASFCADASFPAHITPQGPLAEPAPWLKTRSVMVQGGGPAWRVGAKMLLYVEKNKEKREKGRGGGAVLTKAV